MKKTVYAVVNKDFLPFRPFMGTFYFDKGSAQEHIRSTAIVRCKECGGELKKNHHLKVIELEVDFYQ